MKGKGIPLRLLHVPPTGLPPHGVLSDGVLSGRYAGERWVPLEVVIWAPKGDPELPGILRHELDHLKRRQSGMVYDMEEIFESAGLSEEESDEATTLYDELLANYAQLEAGGSIRQVRGQFMGYAEWTLGSGIFTKEDIYAMDASARRLLGWTGKSIVPSSWRRSISA